MDGNGAISWSTAIHAFCVLLVPALWPYISIFLHEIGHVIAAKLLRLNPTHLIVGESDPFLRKKLFGVELIVCLVPFIGFAVIQPKHTSKTRETLFIAAGPLTDMAIIGLVAVLWIQTPLKTALYLIAVFEFIKVCGNIYPRSIVYEGVLVSTDGKRLLDLYFKPKR